MTDEDLKRSRERLLAEISVAAARTEHYTGQTSFASEVMAAIGRVPRE